MLIGKICKYAFLLCSSLNSVTIQNGVKEIGRHAFINCTSLTSITIPNSVVKVHDLAFWRCSSLTNVEIPESCKTIGYEAFPLECFPCKRNEKIYYFNGQEDIKEVVIPSEFTDISDSSFSGWYFIIFYFPQAKQM